MSKRRTLILLGIFIVLSPFIGLPYSWLMWLLPVLGILVAYLGWSRPRKPAPSHEQEGA